MRLAVLISDRRSFRAPYRAIGAVLISSILGRHVAVAARRAIPQPSNAAITKMLAEHAEDLAFGERGMFDHEPRAVQQQLNAMRRSSTTDAIRRAFIRSAAFALACLGVSTFLPLRQSSK